ncbi:uncharacterized protein LOC144920544 [Branchiostoma floridae x Branchiostoma belcheri]
MLRLFVQEGRAVLAEGRAALGAVQGRGRADSTQPDGSVPALGVPPTVQGLQRPNRAVGRRQARAVFRAAVQAAQAGPAGGNVQGVQAGQQTGNRAVHTQPFECGVSCQGPQGDGCTYSALQYSNMFTPVSNSSCQGVQQSYTCRTAGVLSGVSSPQSRRFHTSSHSFSFPHRLCTSAPDSQAGKPHSCRHLSAAAPADQTGKPPSQRERLKRAVRDYGSTVVVFHVGISLLSLGGFYLAVSSGLDMVALLHKLGVGKAIAESGVATGASMFVIAYAVHKVFAPVRIGITLTCVPFVVRYLRNVGMLR